MTVSHSRLPIVMIGAVALIGLVGTGCATKKYVQTQIDPVTGRVIKVEKETADHKARIGTLETEVSQADEHAQDADKKAAAAAQEAAKAQQQVASARSELGDQINGVRDDAQRKIGDVQKTQRDMDPANYKQVGQETVLFKFGKSQLTDEAKAKLDQMVQGLAKMAFYTIEVEGFTDTTGSANYNLRLSQERADAVVRYLTVDHQIPLRRIHVLGVGELKNQERGRDARAQARRVEMRVFAPESVAALAPVRTSEAR